MAKFARGRGRGRRGGRGRGRGNIEGVRDNSAVAPSVNINPPHSPTLDQTSEPQAQPTGIPEAIQWTSPVLRTPGTSQKPLLGSQLSSNMEGSVHPSSENLNSSEVSCSKSKKGRGRYRSINVDMKTKYGSKITVHIPDDIDRAEKFEAGGGRGETVLLRFVASTMKRLFRIWKTRLHAEYSRYNTDEERLSHPPKDVMPEDWKFLIEYFGSQTFKAKSERNKINRKKQTTKHLCGSRSFAEVEESMRDPLTGEKAPPDRVWELQHTRKNDKGELLWARSKNL